MTNTKVALGIHTTALATATIVQFILAPFNAGGRPVLGAVTDRLGPRVAAMITFVLIIAAAAGMIVVRQRHRHRKHLNKCSTSSVFAFYAGLAAGWRLPQQQSRSTSAPSSRLETMAFCSWPMASAA